MNDRAEVALRDHFAASALAGLCANPGGPFQSSAACGWAITNCDVGDIAKTAYDCADAMLSARALALTPPVAPKSEAAKYEPKVGDVVRFKDSAALWVVDGRVPSNRYFTVGIADAVKGSRGCCDPHELTYVRESTDAEKRLAGLPSPEATRPTHVFHLRSAVSRTEPRKVVRWYGNRPVIQSLADGSEVTLGGTDLPWEPCSPPPAPVEPAKGGTVENMAAHLAWCAWCGTDDRSELPYDAFRAGYRTALAARGGS